ncbi:UNVERIFIED_CONTAM: hypothetical protein HHA_275740 [Hammondia hammondi]|eukprot:XP_008888344.1 hypothetical protein HHA_275740 [Hammondia hammondi]
MEELGWESRLPARSPAAWMPRGPPEKQEGDSEQTRMGAGRGLERRTAVACVTEATRKRERGKQSEDEGEGAVGEDMSLLLRACEEGWVGSIRAASKGPGRKRGQATGDDERRALRTPLCRALKALRQLPDFVDPTLFALPSASKQDADRGLTKEKKHPAENGQGAGNGERRGREALSLGRSSKRRRLPGEDATASPNAETESDTVHMRRGGEVPQGGERTNRTEGDREQEGEEGQEGDHEREQGEGFRREASVSVRDKAIEALHALLPADAASLLCRFCPSVSSFPSRAFAPSPDEQEAGRNEREERSRDIFEGEFLDEAQLRLVLEREARTTEAGGAFARERLLRCLLRSDEIPVVLKRHPSDASLSASVGGRPGPRRKSRGEKTQAPKGEETTYSFCSVKPLQSAAPSRVSSPASPASPSSSNVAFASPAERDVCCVGDAQPWKDCFLNAGSSVWALAISEELPGGRGPRHGPAGRPLGEHRPRRRSDGSRSPSLFAGDELRRARESRRMPLRRGAPNCRANEDTRSEAREREGEQEREREGEQEREQEGFVVLAVGVHGRQSLLSCLGGLRVSEGDDGKAFPTASVRSELDACGAETESPRGPADASGCLSQSCRSSTDTPVSEDVASRASEWKEDCTHAPHAREQREKGSERDTKLGALQLWRISSDSRKRPRFVMGILHAGGACRSLEWLPASALDLRSASEDSFSCLSETQKEAPKTTSPQRQEDSEERARTEEENIEERRGHARARNNLFASRVGLLAATFADDSLRIWSIPLAPFLEEEREEEEREEEREEGIEEGVEGNQRATQETGSQPRSCWCLRRKEGVRGCCGFPSVFSEGAERCVFLPPVWTFRCASPQATSSPFFCVAGAPPPLPDVVSSRSDPSLVYDQAPLQLAVGSDAGRLLLFSFSMPQSQQLQRPSNTSPVVSTCSSSSACSASPSLSSSSPLSSPLSASSGVSRPECVWSAVSTAGPSAHVRSCTFLPSADSSLVAVSAAAGGDDSSSNNGVVFLDVRFAAPGGSADVSPALPPLEGKSGCVSCREIFDLAWGPLGRFATAAATNAVIINLQRPQVTQLALKQILSLFPASRQFSARAKAGGRGGKTSREGKESAWSAQEAVDRCCWSTCMCGHLGLFVFDDGSFLAGSLSLLEQRVCQSAELVRWTFPGFFERRLVSSHRSASREGETLSTPGASGTSREGDPPTRTPKTKGCLASEGACVPRVSLSVENEAQQFDAEPLPALGDGLHGALFRSLHRRVAARFAQQQERQVQQLARHGLLVQIFGEEEETASAEENQDETQMLPHATTPRSSRQGVKHAERKEQRTQAEQNDPSGEEVCDEGEAQNSPWRPEDDRILALHRIVSVCPFRNRRYFGRRPLAIYGGAAGIIHLRVLR